jgi:hypothetical protein
MNRTINSGMAERHRGTVNAFQGPGTVQRMQSAAGPFLAWPEYGSYHLFVTTFIQASNLGQAERGTVPSMAILHWTPESGVANNHISGRASTARINKDGISAMLPPRPRQPVRHKDAQGV